MRYPARPPPFASIALPQDYFHHALTLGPTAPDGRYLHWDDLRWRTPPKGLTKEEWWGAHKMARLTNRVTIAGLRGGADRLPFWYCRLNTVDRATHELDRRDAAREMIRALGDDGHRESYRIDQLIEEAINSSLIEGAKLTTRAQAKAMVREGRTPETRGERMVLNNFHAMSRLLEMVNAPLAVEDILEIHAILGENALDVNDGAGRLRRPDEPVRVEDATTGDVWFVPCHAHELPDQLSLLLDFANAPIDSSPFLHPLLRAIILHFWLAHLHPFVDGNGRMARALFYWQMLRSGYDFARYLSISGPIDRSPRAYYLAFAHTQSDEGDLTYFLLHQLDVLREATEDLLTHLRDRSQRLSDAAVSMSIESMNQRQQDVLVYLLRHPAQGTTVNAHATSHGVAYLTARKDLQTLEALGLVRRVRIGHTDKYLPAKPATPPSKPAPKRPPSRKRGA